MKRKRKRILIVDDDARIRQLLTEFLQDRFVVTEATNGAEALEAMRRYRPDGVVLDIRMPVMDGLSFLRVRARHPDYAAVPVLVVSAESTACDDGRRLGAQACLTKPFDLEHVTATLDHLVTEAQPIEPRGSKS